MGKKALYAGSFDPFTNGHLDIVLRALKIFDEITLLVAHSPTKKTLLTVKQRVELIKDVFDKLDKKREGFIPVTTIQTIFNGKNHPLVALGGGVNDDALEHFLFSTTMKTCRSKPLAYFTYEPFEDYYADLSIAIDNDDVFYDIINSNFNL